MRYIIKLFAIILAFSLFNVQAKAEFCWKIGCVNKEGYILIPDTQFWTEIPKTVIIEGKEYPFDPVIEKDFNAFHLFKEQGGKPEIGKIVTLEFLTAIMDDEEITRVLNEPDEDNFLKQNKKGYGIEPYYKKDAMVVAMSEWNGSFPLATGSKVQILNYKTITHNREDYLFAKVKVIDDRYGDFD